MTLANTQSLSTDFNVEPYYDDYNESKNFHRILYRPGFAVQGRELTQTQTMLQNQIDRFAEHVFTEGSVVRGMELLYDTEAQYVQLKDNNINGNEIDVTNFDNKSVSSNNGITANVITVLAGSETSNTKNTLYVTYKSKSSVDNTTDTFSNNQVITSVDGHTANVITSSDSTGTGSILTIGEGIIFAKDNFIRVDEQTIVIGKYSANTSVRVGYDIKEEIVTSTDDDTLLDPAKGAYNFAAPGADRLRLTATLTTKSYDDTDASNFVEIARIQNGNIAKKSDKPEYSKINDYIARRTYNESGHYISKGMKLKIREHLKQANNGGVYTAAQGGDSEQLSIDLKPGVAYVFGYEIENTSTSHIPTAKGLDTQEINAGSVTANYGNYIIVNEVCGKWDYNNHDKVSLRDSNQNAISNNTFSSGVLGSEIGTARVRAMEFVSGNKGTPSAQYRLYLYDIDMTSGPFLDVRSVYFNDTEADGKADIVLNSSGNAEPKEKTFNTSVYELPSSSIRRIRDDNGLVDTSYQFLKKFDVSISSGGTFSLSTGNANERYQDTGLQSTTQKNSNFYVVLDNPVTSSANVDTGSTSGGSNTISGLTNADQKFNVGDRIVFNGFSNTHIISNVSSTSVNTFEPIAFTTSSTGIKKSFAAGSVIDMSGVGGDASNRSINVTSSTDASFDIQETLSSGVDATVLVELNRVNAQEKSKTLRPNRLVEVFANTNVGGTTGPWSLGFADVYKINSVRKSSSQFTSINDGVDVTKYFTFDNGQRDNVYQLGQLKIKSNTNPNIGSNDTLLVNLTNFDEDTSQGTGYYSVDSYPIDDSNIANTNAITTSQIPTFTSPVTGLEHNLRDCIDIRPRVQNTANSTNTLTDITINPSNNHTILEGTGNGLRYPAPNENFTIDYSFYLPRVDRIGLDKDGRVRVIPGVSSKNPKAPKATSDMFNMGTVHIAPFPSTIAGVGYNFNANTTGFSYLNVNRPTNYTMKEIGTLEQRISALEYYTSLNLLEKSAETLNIPDSNGLNRFKSGFLVDNFSDRNVADTNNDDFKVLLDNFDKKVTPRFYDEFVEMNYNSSSTTGVTRSSGDIRLTITNAGSFTEGETVSASGATGTLIYQVNNRLYITDLSGTFPSSGNITGNDSGASATITSKTERPDGSFVTLPYSHDEIIVNNTATNLRNAAGVAYSWEGSISLVPNTDIWVDTRSLEPITRTERRRNPSISEDEVENNENITRERRDNGVVITTRSEVQETQDIPFIRSQELLFLAQGMKFNGRVYPFFDDVDVSEYCIPTDNKFNPTGNSGDPLVATSNGIVQGIFTLPNNDDQRFETGELPFTLIDSPTNSREKGDYTSIAETSFTAEGTVETVQETIISTRPRRTRRGNGGGGGGGPTCTPTGKGTCLGRMTKQLLALSVGRDRRFYENGGRGPDPVAQVFRVADSLNEREINTQGMFLTRVDLYFGNKDPNLGIEVEIREVDPSSGYVTNNIVPYSNVLVNTENVNVDSTKPVPTPVYFDTPIYLFTEIDYAIVVKPVGGNPNYNVWVSRLGNDDVVTGNRVGKTPLTGLLFVSANDRTWTAVQDEDLTMKMHFADFGQNQGGDLYLDNDSNEYLLVSNTDSRITESMKIDGETELTLTSQPSANVGEFVQGITSGANGVLESFTSNTYSVSDVTLNAKYSTGENVRFLFSNGTPTGVSSTIFSQNTANGTIYFFDPNLPNSGRITLENVNSTFKPDTKFKEQNNGYTGYIDDIARLNADEVVFTASKLNLESTSTSTSLKLASSNNTLDNSFIDLNENDTTFFDNRKYVLGQTQEDSGLGGASSAQIRVAMDNAFNKRHSPVLDISRVGLVVSQSFINNDTANETNFEGGNADTKYISKTVTLKEGFDAEDLRVILTAFDPSESNIDVYAKLLNSEDNRTIDDIDWEKMSRLTNPTVVSKDEDRDNLIEIEYNLPDSVLIGPSGEYQYTNNGVTYTGYKYFKIKIVMTTSNNAKYPILDNYRAIALQV